MLSVLIPTYNFNSFPLVESVYNQLKESKIDFEIICLDDASQSDLNSQNQKINQLDFCSFSELETNMGRSAIRNFLVEKANYNWLLFLDGDVMPFSSNFINNYIEEITKNKFTVFCGGIKYQRDKENKESLHVKHGIENEEVTSILRNKKPYKYFFTSNFLIKKDVFDLVKFEEKLIKYGREDFLFAKGLKEKGIQIHHISNEILHLGVEDDITFVNKTKQAMKNLHFLASENLVSWNETILLRILKILESLKISKLIGRLQDHFERKTLKNKSLFYLNCLKVSYLCNLKANHGE